MHLFQFGSSHIKERLDKCGAARIQKPPNTYGVLWCCVTILQRLVSQSCFLYTLFTLFHFYYDMGVDLSRFRAFDFPSFIFGFYSRRKNSDRCMTTAARTSFAIKIWRFSSCIIKCRFLLNSNCARMSLSPSERLTNKKTNLYTQKN